MENAIDKSRNIENTTIAHALNIYYSDYYFSLNLAEESADVGKHGGSGKRNLGKTTEFLLKRVELRQKQWQRNERVDFDESTRREKQGKLFETQKTKPRHISNPALTAILDLRNLKPLKWKSVERFIQNFRLSINR